MTGFDIAVLLLVGVGAVTGFLRGFVQEVLALFAWIFALFAIHFLHTPLSYALAPTIGTNSGASVLAFALLLLVPYAVIRLVANWLGARSRGSLLGPVDRVLGFGFGAIKGLIIVVLAFSVLVLGYDTVWGVGGRPEWITQARAYRFINASSEGLVTLIAQRRQEAIEADRAAQEAKDARETKEAAHARRGKR
jgi:membrane protein required for colicin V production